MCLYSPLLTVIMISIGVINRELVSLKAAEKCHFLRMSWENFDVSPKGGHVEGGGERTIIATWKGESYCSSVARTS